MTQETPKPNRIYKARLFEMIFSQKEECLSLYNAVNGTDYKDPEQLEINTLENAIYMSMHNDISFVIDSRLSLYEHQSTRNPNLPLRFLFYVANLYAGIVNDENLYSEKQIWIPTPQFLIFYNGEEWLPEREILKLSDAFEVKESECSLELTATLLNINPGQNEGLKAACRTLADYAEYTARVRENAKTMSIAQAVEDAIEDCIRNGILSEFLTKNRVEAMSMSIFEYDEEKHMQQEREEHWADGHKAGLEEGHQAGLEEGISSTKKIFKFHMAGKSNEEIAEECQIPLETVEEILS